MKWEIIPVLGKFLVNSIQISSFLGKIPVNKSQIFSCNIVHNQVQIGNKITIYNLWVDEAFSMQAKISMYKIVYKNPKNKTEY